MEHRDMGSITGLIAVDFARLNYSYWGLHTFNYSGGYRGGVGAEEHWSLTTVRLNPGC